MNNFFKNGFVIIKNAIDKRLISEIHNIIVKKGSNKHIEFLKLVKKNKKNYYEFVHPFHKLFLFHDIYQKVLCCPKILKQLKVILGSDLAHHEDPSLTLNVSDKKITKNNYLFKGWHQEFWSGASTSTLAVWSPIFLPNNKSGQMEFIVGSHTWGHVPHKNRTPIFLPKKFKSIKVNLNKGDIVLFHSLLIHRSLPIKSKKFDARLALVTHVKNFKHKDYSFDINKSWRIFNYSDLTQIEKKLGNHHLSPFRLISN